MHHHQVEGVPFDVGHLQSAVFGAGGGVGIVVADAAVAVLVASGVEGVAALAAGEEQEGCGEQPQ